MKLERLISAAGYDATTPVAVGVGSASATVLVSHGDCDSVAYAGSLAKQVTGACAALLARDGALDLEAPVAGWLPELPGWSGTVRVRHLIHHTAGLPSTEDVWKRAERAGEKDWTSDGVISALAGMDELEHPPGEVYAYFERRLHLPGTRPRAAVRRGSRLVRGDSHVRASRDAGDHAVGLAPAAPPLSRAALGRRRRTLDVAAGSPLERGNAAGYARRGRHDPHGRMATTGRRSTTPGASASFASVTSASRATAEAGTTALRSSCGCPIWARASRPWPPTGASSG